MIEIGNNTMSSSVTLITSGSEMDSQLAEELKKKIEESTTVEVVIVSPSDFPSTEPPTTVPTTELPTTVPTTVNSTPTPTPTPMPTREPWFPIYDPFILGDNTNYETQSTCYEQVISDIEVLRRYLAVRDAFPEKALKHT